MKQVATPTKNASDTQSLRGWWLYSCGTILSLSTLLQVLSGTNFGTPTFLGLMALASAAYLVAMFQATRLSDGPRLSFLICLGFAAMLRLPLLFSPSGEHDDIYRYIWDGRLQRLGYNPYLAVPSDPGLKFLHTHATSRMNNPDIPSPYPAGAQIFFRAVTTVHESVIAFRLAILICDALIVILLVKWLAVSGLSKWLVLTYAWHPLVAFEGARNGHVDILGSLLLFLSFAALTQGRRILACVAFALGVSVKFLPLVLLPLFIRRVRFRDAALATTIFLALFIPFLSDSQIPMGGLMDFVDRFRFNGPLFSLLEQSANPRLLIGLAVVGGLLAAVFFRVTSFALRPEAWAYPMAVALVFAPAVYPWYLLWLTPFLSARVTIPLMIWTLSILATYTVWDLVRFGAEWKVPVGISVFEYGTVAAAAVWFALDKKVKRGNEA